MATNVLLWFAFAFALWTGVGMAGFWFFWTKDHPFKYASDGKEGSYLGAIWFMFTTGILLGPVAWYAGHRIHVLRLDADGNPLD